MAMTGVGITVGRKVFPAQGGAPARLLFENLDLALAPGEVCAVVGPSGVGKTTLLQITAGLDRAYDGTVTGRPARIGYHFQSPRLLPWRTARENLELVLPGRPDDALAWLDRVGLAEAAEVYPQRLSLGMARRVSLARALAIEPQLLLLDEPFAALDEATAEAMQRVVARELARLRPTTLLVTHHWPEAAALADRVITLEGSPARIVDDHPLVRSRAAE
ncbi:MAG TPA: ATP-binding cassette domain-containing protein [Microvirga sp.]|jgi:NitT/TauT family transport system ATP-binding protein|nr:ATP-binding cassette domain-containing protein [Microvirga sp.]